MRLPAKTRKFLVQTIQEQLGDKVPYTLILFGSYADESARATSDIDIAIKMPEPLDAARWALIKETFEESDLPQRVDVVDYQRVLPEFQKIIDRGRVLFSNAGE